ncbi:MAG TPA: murein L,D-transpeptidase catalytic domain family protein [Gemmatimonadaceae bacterium]|nr:murein L,D-transpeptidase catalytic domain family protein [Gemmatimonadaceae bacterium]
MISVNVKNVLLGVTAAAFVGAPRTKAYNENGPILNAAITFVTKRDSGETRADTGTAPKPESQVALEALKSVVGPLSHPRALEEAFHGYFAFKTAHPADVKKPYLYFVDYGLPATKPRGYVFDMVARTIVDGPFMVAAGRGSSMNKDGIPTSFSNRTGSAATSLGLYLADNLYNFRGHAAGRTYTAVGLRLKGLSEGFNDNAYARGVVAHGAPYVTSKKAGRSEGCPALEPARAQRLLPKLANGGLVFLFAPREDWMAKDPWLAPAAAASSIASAATSD